MEFKRVQSVYVTRRVPGNALQQLADQFETYVHSRSTPPSKKTLLRCIRGRSAILCMLSDKIDREVIEAAGGNLKIISSYSTGIDHIDIDEATSRGIFVTYTSDILAESTADLAFALMMAAARDIIKGDRLVREGKWHVGWQPDLMLGCDIYGATIGIIGLGRIGTAVAKRARGFSMNVLYHSRTRKQDLESEMGIQYRELDDLLSESDFISIHTDSNQSTMHLVNEKNMQFMKKTAVVVNTSRGSAIDTPALTRLLKRRAIRAACLDVFETEPVPKSSPLLQMKNAILTPHIGSATTRTREKMTQVAVDSIIAVLTGKTPVERFVVNKKLLLQ